MREYVVWNNIENEIHRGPWEKEKCLDWIRECREIFPPMAEIDKLWRVRSRAVGPWEDCNVARKD